MNGSHNICSLCRHHGAVLYHHDRARKYLQCKRCGLVFVPPNERLTRAEEKARYDLHRNDPYDPRYRGFLSRLAGPILERVPVGSEGLDFGCGPGPALAMMLHEKGRPMTVYDPFYAPDDAVWSRTYDFITATEVVEHLYRPGEELDRLFRVLRPGGWLGIMTKKLSDHENLHNWCYMRDPTHVCFFGLEAFEYISAYWNASLEMPGSNVFLFQKRTHAEQSDTDT
ncbi:MAG: class I SAM-dependent methyltransferase [Nitrospirae bacterium]|nr:class I SAM-dependent methyltransferase [Nitrospirota bacterium]